MDLVAMIRAAGDASKVAKKQQQTKYDTRESRKTVYAVLTHTPVTKKQLMRETGLSEHVLSQTLKEMVRCGSALGVFPGEFGRRMMYIRGK